MEVEQRRTTQQSEETRLKTSFIANVVVRSLSRYYSLGAFKDKAIFKEVARELTRRLVKSGISDDDGKCSLLVVFSLMVTGIGTSFIIV
ncbi:unnamed protein product [Hydatigera taeniaeformis]|uniref:DUF4244 domain-containing protein n=1 Tax=Hydatigena taeniaeformis TaxID=6205 RepID=A0A0R3WYV0_HYDTA|nr:unnamed protein product [Hydatigera taeniaeformis]